MIEVKQLLIPKSNTTTRPGIKLVPRYITVHETDNTSAGATAAAHARLQYNGNSRTASWHYTVDDHEIWQSIPDDEVAWHAGDGRNGTGNRESLAVEICVNSDGNFEKAKANAIWLIRQLMDKHGIPIERVVPHQHWSGKNCPRHILTYWNTFINEIKSGGDSMPSIQYHEVNQLPLSIGAMGDMVKKLQARLQIAVDGKFGPATESAVKNWQKAHGLKVDGIVGPQTWGALFPEPSKAKRIQLKANGKVIFESDESVSIEINLS